MKAQWTSGLPARSRPCKREVPGSNPEAHRGAAQRISLARKRASSRRRPSGGDVERERRGLWDAKVSDW